MGGHITGVATEQYQGIYDGALPMCGVMGDAELFDYFLDYQLVAQALAGIQATYPYPADYQTAIVPAAKAVLGAPFPTSLTPAGLKLRAVTERISGGTRPGFEFAFGSPTVATNANFLFQQSTPETVGVAPGRVMGNIDTIYQLDNDPALSPDEQALNAAVLRVARDPQGVHPNGLANIPVVNGTLAIPTLSMHTLYLISEPEGNYLIVAVPTTPGDYELSLSLNMTFVVDEGGRHWPPSDFQPDALDWFFSEPWMPRS
jgi:hypothetical protein